MWWWLRNLRNLSALRYDAELGAAARTVQFTLDLLSNDVDTYVMDDLTADLNTSTPEERADAITELVFRRLEEDVRENLIRTSSVDASRMVFSLCFREVRLALPPSIAHYISHGNQVRAVADLR